MVKDYRRGREIHQNDLTDADIDQISFAMLKFGDFDAPAELVRALLRSRGYGEIT
jgi:hypothetical protein